MANATVPNGVVCGRTTWNDRPERTIEIERRRPETEPRTDKINPAFLPISADLRAPSLARRFFGMKIKPEHAPAA